MRTNLLLLLQGAAQYNMNNWEQFGSFSSVLLCFVVLSSTCTAAKKRNFNFDPESATRVPRQVPWTGKSFRLSFVDVSLRSVTTAAQKCLSVFCCCFSLIFPLSRHRVGNLMTQLSGKHWYPRWGTINAYTLGKNKCLSSTIRCSGEGFHAAPTCVCYEKQFRKCNTVHMSESMLHSSCYTRELLWKICTLCFCWKHAVILCMIWCARAAHVERNRSSEMCTLIMFAYFTNIISLVETYGNFVYPADEPE